jgi:hypothetical protein
MHRLRLLGRPLERAAGLGEKDVVESGRTELEVCHVDAVLVDRANDVREPEALPKSHGYVAARRERFAEASEELRDARPVLVTMRDRVDARAPDLGLELRRCALGDDLPLIDDPDPICENVGLLEVLGREEDGDAILASQ